MYIRHPNMNMYAIDYSSLRHVVKKFPRRTRGTAERRLSSTARLHLRFVYVFPAFRHKHTA